MSDIKRLIKKSLSDADLRRILGADLKILKYSQLSKVDSLDTLFPSELDYCIILIEEELDSGHWVALMKYDNTVEFFDPYGKKWDTELAWVPMNMRRQLGETQKYLSGLLERTKLKRVYSPYHFEQESKSVNTCGDHCAHRIYRLRHNNMDLHDYYCYMENTQEKLKASPDEIVAEFVGTFGI